MERELPIDIKYCNISDQSTPSHSQNEKIDQFDSLNPQNFSESEVARNEISIYKIPMKQNCS
jgi:hypothetical protein